jgi:glycosyltransferase involved in cell wall biosynthesis
MKILHFLHYPDNGIVTVVFDQIRHSVATGLEYHVVLLQRSPKVDRLVSEYGIQVHYLDRSPFSALVGYRRLLQTLVPDIIHAHSYRPRLMTALAKRLGWWNGAAVATVHAEYPYLVQRDLRSRLKRATEAAALRILKCPVVVNNQRVNERIADSYNVCGFGIRKIYNGVAYHRAAKYSGSKRTPIAISVARFTPEKNHGLLLEAWVDVLKQVPDAKLWLLGDGEQQASMEEKTRALHIADSVIFLGWVDRDSVPSYLSQAQVFVLSSFHEGLSTAAIEACLAELPVVSTDVAGIDEIIEPGISGLIVTGRDSLANALIELLSNPLRCEALGRSARERAERLFGIGRYISEVEELYRTIAPEPSVRGYIGT